MTPPTVARVGPSEYQAEKLMGGRVEIVTETEHTSTTKRTTTPELRSCVN
jgi:hypothetical protein